MAASLAAKIRAANKALLVKAQHERIGDFFAPDYIVHLTDQDVKGGHTIVRPFLELYRSAFPDLAVEVQILNEKDDRVSWQRTLRATHQGAYKGFPASGQKLVWRDVVTSRFRNGLIVEEWVISDLAEQLLLSRKKR